MGSSQRYALRMLISRPGLCSTCRPLQARRPPPPFLSRLPTGGPLNYCLHGALERRAGCTAPLWERRQPPFEQGCWRHGGLGGCTAALPSPLLLPGNRSAAAPGSFPHAGCQSQGLFPPESPPTRQPTVPFLPHPTPCLACAATEQRLMGGFLPHRLARGLWLCVRRAGQGRAGGRERESFPNFSYQLSPSHGWFPWPPSLCGWRGGEWSGLLDSSRVPPSKPPPLWGAPGGSAGMASNAPAFLGVFVPFVVELQRDLCIQTDAEVIIHDASFGKLSETSRDGGGRGDKKLLRNERCGRTAKCQLNAKGSLRDSDSFQAPQRARKWPWGPRRCQARGGGRTWAA